MECVRPLDERAETFLASRWKKGAILTTNWKLQPLDEGEGTVLASREGGMEQFCPPNWKLRPLDKEKKQFWPPRRGGREWLCPPIGLSASILRAGTVLASRRGGGYFI